jgi:hypothetical protein
MNDVPRYSWEWQPASADDAATWQTVGDTFKLANIASSRWAGESVIRGIASHDWGPDERPEVIRGLLENPNLTPELLSWLDKQSVKWGIDTQWNYWITRYGVNSLNVNYMRSGGEAGPVRSFAPSLIDSTIDANTAAQQIVEISDHFAEQMWHDLAVQEVVVLNYVKDNWEGDRLRPYIETEAGPLELGDETHLDLVSPGYLASWLDHVDYLDVDYARDRASWEWSDRFQGDWQYTVDSDNPFSDANLAFVVAAGLATGDFKHHDESAYGRYLEAAYRDHESMFDSEVTITADSPWAGPRFRDLTATQQMNFTANLLATIEHPFLGAPRGLAWHFLICIWLHASTVDAVRELIASRGIDGVADIVSAVQS